MLGTFRICDFPPFPGVDNRFRFKGYRSNQRMYPVPMLWRARCGAGELHTFFSFSSVSFFLKHQGNVFIFTQLTLKKTHFLTFSSRNGFPWSLALLQCSFFFPVPLPPEIPSSPLSVNSFRMAPPPPKRDRGLLHSLNFSLPPGHECFLFSGPLNGSLSLLLSIQERPRKSVFHFPQVHVIPPFFLFQP